MNLFHLHITTPEGNNWDSDAVALKACGSEGSLGVLANHAPMIAALKPGVLSVRDPDTTRFFAAGPGVLEVRIDKEVVILTDYADACATEAEAQARVLELGRPTE